MKIKVGTKNKAKLDAVVEILKEYPHLAQASIEGLEADSCVSDQPKSIDETINGAMNRAKQVFVNCDYSFGIESGIFHVPQAKSGYMDVCVCAIYDGKEFHLGFSSAWEFPDKRFIEMILNEGLNMTDAANRFGITSDTKIGHNEGVISIVTKGRLNRKEYTKQALRTALIHLDEHEFLK